MEMAATNHTQDISASAEFLGVVVDDPKIKETSVQYIVQSKEEKILIITRLYPRFQYLDKVEFTCKIKKSEDAYLIKEGINALCKYPKYIKKIGHVKNPSLWLSFKGSVFVFKESVINRINLLLPHPESAFLAGLLMGETGSIPRFLKDVFAKTGTLHILAISGYNISIIVQLIFVLAPYLFIARRAAWFLAMPVIGFFIVLTGAESSAVRAGVMAIIAGLAVTGGRVGDVRRCIVLAAVTMLLINPYLLIFDIGFQLSFAATLGLVFIAPKIDLWLQKLIPYKKSTLIKSIRESFSVTCAASFAVAPITLFAFGSVSLISPLVNLLIVGAVPYAMALGAAALFTSYIFFPLGQVLGWSSFVVLRYIIEVVKGFG